MPTGSRVPSHEYDDLRTQIEATNERVFTRGDLDHVDEVSASGVVMHNVAHGADYEGREAFEEWVRGLRETVEFEAGTVHAMDGATATGAW